MASTTERELLLDLVLGTPIIRRHAPGKWLAPAGEHNGSMRADAKPSQVILAFAKAIESSFSRGDWIELGLLTSLSALLGRYFSTHPSARLAI